MYLHDIHHHWRVLLLERKFRRSLVFGLLLLSLSVAIYFLTSAYVDTIPMIPVGDLILDAIPPVDLTVFFVFGIFSIYAVITVYPIFFKPELLPFTAKTFAAFIAIRSFFVLLTHIGAPAEFRDFWLNARSESLVFKAFFVNDLFFSGHVGMPFLAALIFWENKPVRSFMLVMSAAMGATVLLMHVHYSIDVFAAYFITYSIYIVSDRIFNNLNRRFRAVVERVSKKMRALTSKP